MKVLQINMTYGKGSTGKIVADIMHGLEVEEHEAYALYGYGEIEASNIYRTQNNIILYYMAILHSRLFGRSGFYNKRETKKLIYWIDKINPDIVHLHNIHGFYLNVEYLFRYLEEKGIYVVWTLHDCWSMTGHCACFDYVECDKWKTGCSHCQQLKYYPICYVDRSRENYYTKKKCFTAIDITKMQLVVPSKWLGHIVEQSYLKLYPRKQIYNGVDLELFKPKKEDIKLKMDIQNKKMILAVTFGYNERKGILDLNILVDMLSTRYQIVLVGVPLDKRKKIDDRIILMPKTDSQEDLANYYSAADVYVNVSLEEVLGMTNIEALACGTPVVTYSSGGSSECIDERTGIVVPKRNVEKLKIAIEEVIEKGKENYQEECVKRAKKVFDKNNMVEQYINVYKSMVKDR